MKKFLITTAAIFHSIIIFSQTNIVSKITPDHSEVFGSKISMIMPADFKRSANFLGFVQEDTNSSIMVLDFSTAFQKVSNGLTKENFEKQGVIVKSLDSIVFNNLPGYFISGMQKAYGSEFTKYILVFGSDAETIMINGVAPKDNPLLSESVKRSLLSSVYDGQRILSPLDAVDYKVATDGTDFVFSKSNSNVLTYDREQGVASKKADNAIFVIAKSISKSNFGDKKEFALNRMKALPMGISTFTTTEAISINGLDGFEITAEGFNRKSGEKEYAFLTILYNDLDYYLLYGSSSKNVQENTAMFQKIAQTFVLK